jgi:hypothetical protein
MSDDSGYPDDMPPVEESLDLDDDDDVSGTVKEEVDSFLNGRDEAEGEAVRVNIGDEQIVVMPGADCVRCGRQSVGVVVAKGKTSKWQAGDAEPYCADCKEAMFPHGVTNGFEWRTYK